MQIKIFQAEVLFQSRVLLAANEDLDRAMADLKRITLALTPQPTPAGLSIEQLLELGPAAAKQMREGEPLRARAFDEIWMALQQLLGAAANISRLLWSGDAQGALTQREAARTGLRASIGVTDSDSFALKDRALRNHWEHIDEKVEAWWSGNTRHVFSHRSIGFNSGPSIMAEKDEFLYFDGTTKIVTFWGLVVRVPELVDEARTLESRLEAILKTEWWRHA
jgi:hypothetical protein